MQKGIGDKSWQRSMYCSPGHINFILHRSGDRKESSEVGMVGTGMEFEDASTSISYLREAPE